MSVLRWLIPVVLLACLGGFILGYHVPQWIPGTQVSFCSGGLGCGAATGVGNITKLPKMRVGEPAGQPTMLTEISVVKRGEEVPLLVQTAPGAICAVSVFYNGGHDTYTLPVTFANAEGHCNASLDLPQSVTVGKGRLLICASACLDQQFFEIQ